MYRITSQLLKRKQLFGIVIAAGILAAIFVPFQKAQAYSFNITGLDGTSTSTSSGLISFTITLNVQPAEVIPVQQISVLIDGSTVAAFDKDGNQISGTPNGVVSLGAPNVPTSNGFAYGYGSSYGYGYGLIGGYGYGATNAPYVKGFIGPTTVTWTATLNPALVSAGIHTFQAIIYTGVGSGSSSQIYSVPSTFTVSNVAGTATLNVFAKRQSDNSDIIPGMAIELRQGLTLIQSKFTSPTGSAGPAMFTLNGGQSYTVYATDFGNLYFVQWSDGTTSRGHDISLTNGQTSTLTALYAQASTPSITLTVTSKTSTGTTITGMFNKVTLGASADVKDIVSSGFTPKSYTLQANTRYTAFASNYAQYVFDHWENAASPGVTLPSAVNLRGTAVTSATNLNLVAVYNVIPSATTLTITTSTYTNTVTISGLPGTAQVQISINGIAGSGLIQIVPESPALLSKILTLSGTTGILSSGGSSFTTAGSILEVDTSGLQFTGTMTLTITYDPLALAAAGVAEDPNTIKVFHYTGTAWEDVTVPGSLSTLTHSVQAKLTGGSASPVAVAFTRAATSSGSSGGGGGGGGGSAGGGGSICLNCTPGSVTTYDQSYFAVNPLAMFSLNNVALMDLGGNSVSQVKVGQSVAVSEMITNHEKIPQTYAYVVEVTNQDGLITSLNYVQSSLPSGQSTSAFTTWTPDAAGTYTVKVFVWDGIGDKPTALTGNLVNMVSVQK